MPQPPAARRPLPHRLPTPPAPPARILAAMLAGLLVLLATTHPTSAAPADPAGSTSWPLAPRPEVVSPFDPPDSAWSGGHRGVDLRGVPGQPVRAAVGGTVAYAGLLAGKGVVVVRHGSTRTTYEPVDATVEVGAVVVPGDVLGHLHPGGSHCFPRTCLHWGLIETTVGGDVYRDPLTLVGAGSVRLLPWTGLRAAASPAGATAPARPSIPERQAQARGWAWR